MPDTIIVDDAEKTIIERLSAGWPNTAGSTREVITTWKVATDQTRKTSIETAARQALTVNDAFLAIATPTNPQVAAQVQRLTKECSALIRLLLQQLDSTAGT